MILSLKVLELVRASKEEEEEKEDEAPVGNDSSNVPHNPRMRGTRRKYMHKLTSPFSCASDSLQSDRVTCTVCPLDWLREVGLEGQWSKAFSLE